MRKIYSEMTANYPRLKSDSRFADYENDFKHGKLLSGAFDTVLKGQMLCPELWAKFVNQFREQPDGRDNGWRGEYWGKMMRGGVLVYSATSNRELYKILSDTVCDILTAQEECGRISTYSKDKEFDGWDIWCRRHVLLGMQYFQEICDNESLKSRITSSMCRQVDYLIDKIGRKEDGKLPITLSSSVFYGINSCTILEAIVRLYSITNEKRYLDFAEYIISTGGLDSGNIFELAYNGDLPPYLYPATKANEMISCFEGALEYYRVTGDEYYKDSVIRFADRILSTDFTVIGSSGCTHELFDHSTVRQANTTNGGIMQETCVTVTLMELMYNLHLLTGDSKYADAFERSFYNALLGALNTENAVGAVFADRHPNLPKIPLPFDSYSPLTAGNRGNAVAGIGIMSDGSYYGCCACIGAIGLGLAPKLQLLSTEKGLELNLFTDGIISSTLPSGNKITLTINTEYPKIGEIEITAAINAPEEFEILIRNPEWSKITSLLVNGENCISENGYFKLNRVWNNTDTIKLTLDMRTRVLYPIPYGEQVLMNVWDENNSYYMTLSLDKEDPLAKHHIALLRGPIVLAQDERLGYSLENPIEISPSSDGFVNTNTVTRGIASYKTIIEAEFPLKNGKSIHLTDYASAGKQLDRREKIAAWILIE